MPRILAVHPGPHFSVADVHNGWVEAFRALGCQVQDFNLGDRLDFYGQAHHPNIEADGYHRVLDNAGAKHLAVQGLFADAFTVWPEVVFVTSSFYVPVDVLHLLRRRGMKVVLAHTESPYEDDVQLERAAHADLNLVNDPTHLDRFQQVAPTLYAAHAYRPSLHHPRPPDPQYASDVAFVGTGLPSRLELLQAVDWSGIDLLLAGHWGELHEDSPLRKCVAHDIDYCLDNVDTARVYTSTKASFNAYRREANRPELSAGWSMGPREVELAACGTWFARESRPESDLVFPMLPAYEGPDELGDVLRWALAHPDERQAAADAARAAVADRTFDSHARNLLRVLGY